jgi:hypothetical protein
MPLTFSSMAARLGNSQRRYVTMTIEPAHAGHLGRSLRVVTRGGLRGEKGGGTRCRRPPHSKGGMTPIMLHQNSLRGNVFHVPIRCIMVNLPVLLVNWPRGHTDARPATILSAHCAPSQGAARNGVWVGMDTTDSQEADVRDCSAT